MNAYLEITLLPNLEEDIPIHFLWEKVYQQLHLAFVEIKDNYDKVPIGLSFPQYDKKVNLLGCNLRLFAPSENELEILNLDKYLSRLRDYLHITQILPVPEHVKKYVFFKRLQPKSSNMRLARRMVKRKNISFEQALLHYENRAVEMTKLPYINMKSQSSESRFRLFIEKIDCENQVAGAFNSYGLSKTATVPWF